MFNILSKYDSYKSIYEKFRGTKEFKIALFECQAKFPAYNAGTNDTLRATSVMHTCFEDWLFSLDENISDLEYTAFLDSYSTTFRNNIREYFLNLHQSTVSDLVDEKNSELSSSVV